jgi:hypothetical protein
MKKKILTLLFLVLLCSSIVFAGHLHLEYDYFMKVNTTEKIKLSDGDVENITQGYLLLDNELFHMNISDSGDYFYINVISDEEEDKDFNAFFGGLDVYRFDNTDNSTEDYIEVDNDMIYTFNYTHNHTHLNNSVIEAIVCVELEALDNPVNIIIKGGVENSSGLIDWYDSDILEINEKKVYCESLSRFVKEDEVGRYPNTYVGFQCLNCVSGNPANRQRLGVYTDDSGTSEYINYIFDNETDINPEISSDDYFIYSITSETEYDEVLRGTMRWREPFNVEIKLNKLNNTSPGESLSYINEFQIVVLDYTKPKTSAENGAVNFINNLNSIIESGFIESEEELDETLSFWGYYTNGSADITLYESGNYTINLLSLDVIDSDRINWDYEFLYPQYSKSKLYSDIVDLIINNETNQSYSIYLDMWEIDKFTILLNLGKVLFIFVFWIVLVIVVSAINLKAGGVIAGVTLPIALKLMGVF